MSIQVILFSNENSIMHKIEQTQNFQMSIDIKKKKKIENH